MNQYRSIQPDKVSSLGNDVQSEIIIKDVNCQVCSWINVPSRMKLCMCIQISRIAWDQAKKSNLYEVRRKQDLIRLRDGNIKSE